MVIDRIDQGLATYYWSNGAKYYNDGIGKFKSYCEEYGFDDDAVEEELSLFAPTDCMLVEFDSDCSRTLDHEHEVLTFGYIRQCLHKESKEISVHIPTDLIRLFARWVTLVEIEPIHAEIYSVISYIHKHNQSPRIMKRSRRNCKTHRNKKRIQSSPTPFLSSLHVTRGTSDLLPLLLRSTSVHQQSRKKRQYRYKRRRTIQTEGRRQRCERKNGECSRRNTTEKQ
eukprot:175797_1